VFEDLSLNIWPNETVLLLGPSGCGKSTLALLISGIIPHVVYANVEGAIEIDGAAVETLPAADLAQQVGVVFQDPEAQFCTFRVRDEVAFGPENLCLDTLTISQRINTALIGVGLNGFEERVIYRLSGGEKQRVAVASVLALNPDILIFDSVTANLDPLGVHQLFAVIRELRRHKTVVVIEQRLDDMIDFVDRVIVLDDSGRVVMDGSPGEVFASGSLVSVDYGFWKPQVAELFLGLRDWRPESGTPLTVSEAAEALRSAGYRIQGGSPAQSDDEKPRSPALVVDGLAYTYQDGTRALDYVSLAIPEGAFYAIVGQNGSGKTTFVQHLTGIKRPPRGKVWLFGKDISELKIREITAQVGYIFQNPEHQFVERSVGEELAYSLKIRGDPEDEITRRVGEACARFGFWDHQVNPHRLSAGEMRRLSVATMLLVEPHVLVLDEPTFGQDHRSAEAIMAILAELHREGRTIIMVTHDMRLVAGYAERVAVMGAGRVIFEGTPLNLFSSEPILLRASLSAPPVFRVARSLNPDARILSLPAFYSAVIAE